MIFASCKKNFLTPKASDQHPITINCNVQGATPGDNVVVSSTSLNWWGCNFITSAQVSKHNVVSIAVYALYFAEPDGTDSFCGMEVMERFVTFSIIVFRPEITSQGIAD